MILMSPEIKGGFFLNLRCKLYIYLLAGCNYRPGYNSSSGKVQTFGHPEEVCQQEVWQDRRVPRAHIESR